MAAPRSSDKAGLCGAGRQRAGQVRLVVATKPVIDDGWDMGWLYTLGKIALALLVLAAIGLLLWHLVLVPVLKRQCEPKFLGMYYLFPQHGVVVPENDGGNAADTRPPEAASKQQVMAAAQPTSSRNDDPYMGSPFLDEGPTAVAPAPPQEQPQPEEPLPLPEPEPAMVRAVTVTGMPITVPMPAMNGAGPDMYEVGKMVRESVFMPHGQELTMFGLHEGTNGSMQVYVPRADMAYDAYGAADKHATPGEPHVVSVFMLPKRSWLCERMLQ